MAVPTYDIIFVKEYMEKVFKEIDYPIDKIVDMVKYTQPIDAEQKPEIEEWNAFKNKVIDIIGKYEFENFIKLQGYACNLLGLYSWDTSLLGQYNYRLSDNYQFKDDKLFMHNSLLCADEEYTRELKFKDTYSIMITSSSTIVVTLKEGFSNFISEVQGNVNKKDLLCEIVNLLPRGVALSSRLAMSYLTIRSKINIK